MKPPSSLFPRGFESISKILIDNGAIIDIQDNDGATPLQLAVSNRNH